MSRHMPPSQLTVMILTYLIVANGQDDFWGKSLESQIITDGGETISVLHHRIGKRYLRGFPRGAWGTQWFPAPVYLNKDKTYKLVLEDIMGDVYRAGEPAVSAYKRYKDAIKGATLEDVKHVITDPVQGLAITFLYRWCTKAWADKEGRDMGQITKTCPDPCLGNPCRRMANVKNITLCGVEGPFEDDFSCTCKDEAEWDSFLHFCRLKNPCTFENPAPCNVLNTLRCVAINDQDVKCICESGFMEPDCTLERNACLERVDKSQPTGNQNCQIKYGNVCTGILGTDHYNCTCRYGYEPSLQMKEENCLTRRDPCQNHYAIEDLNLNVIDFDLVDLIEPTNQSFGTLRERRRNSSNYLMHRGLTCLNGGQCVTSQDLTRAMCLCPTGTDGSALYLGPNCEIPVGTWSAWSFMSPCIPRDCGYTRYRWRRRRCLNTTSSESLVKLGNKKSLASMDVNSAYIPLVRCSGTSEEVIPCDQLDPCMILRLNGYLRSEILNYDTLYYFGWITVIYLVISCLSWYVFAKPLLLLWDKKKNKPVAQVIHRTSDLME